MLRVIDAGNSRTRIADRTSGGLVELGRFETHSALDTGSMEDWLTRSGADGLAPSRAIIASSAPAGNAAWEGAARRGGVPLLWLDARAAPHLPLEIATDRPEQVGADRIANAMAALGLAVDVLVIDMGTAITFDCVSAAGALLGGVIAPGPATLQRGLAGSAPHLPAVAIVRPEGVMGRTSEACLESGLYYAIAGAVDRIAGELRAEWSRDALVITTGGWASLFRDACDCIDRIEPDWTLKGIAAAADYLET